MNFSTIKKPAALLAAMLAPGLALAQGAALTNPLNSQFNSVAGFVSGVLQVLVTLAIPVIGFFLVYSGFLFIAARGNEAKLKDAKNNFLYVIIGAALVLGAWVLANILGATVSQLMS